MPNSSPAHQSSTRTLFSTPLVAALFTEALALVGEGVPAAEVEAASLEAGMPVGLLATIDDMSLDVIDEALHAELHALEHGEHHDHDDSHAHADHGHGHGHDHDHDHDHDHSHDHGHDHGHGHGHGHDHGHDHAPKPASSPTHAPAPHRHAHGVKSKRMPEPAVYVVEKMAHGFRRSGRAAGGGFYDYSSETPELWSGLKTFERRSKALSRPEVIDRLRCIAALTVLGQPAAPAAPSLTQMFGPSLPTDPAAALAWVASMGPQTFVSRSLALAARFGDRFNPSAAVLARVGVA